MKKISWFLPALLVMAVIFAFSSTPARRLPDFGLWDTLVKKGSHMLVYGLLAASYWLGFASMQSGRKLQPGTYAWAFGLSILYALTDEFHQSFVPGRHPSLVDVFVFDGSGALLVLVTIWWRQKARK